MQKTTLIVAMLLAAVCNTADAQTRWTVDSQADWELASAHNRGLAVKDGMAAPLDKSGHFTSTVKRFDTKRTAKSITLTQSPIWQNWMPIDNLGPSNLRDAPVFLSLGPDNYWTFGRYGGKGEGQREFKPETATLEGFEVELLTTPFPGQYDAPGGLQKSSGGYHAWQSRDMVNWVHHGPVTEGFSRWVTSAEFVDGKVYIFYDYPNDQDPHVYIDDNLFDGQPGNNLGMAFNDPSHGSDAGFIRDLDGNFHVIYEDWSPINASKCSWDSPLAGHAMSKTGVGDYKILEPAVDSRTEDTGKDATYKHPHWLQHPDWDTNIAEYDVHEPEQEAYGDWAVIAVGGQYYLFGDFDPIGGHQMSVGWFTASDISKPFTWCDNIGRGHPDPDIGFAEGRFYLFTQQRTDYVSDGPWVEKVEARVGVDTDNDGKPDQWTEWQQVKETYDYTEGFAKQVAKTPAAIDTSKLPAGFGFQFEFKLTDTTENESKPMIDKVTIAFD